MPIATAGAVKTLAPWELRDLGAKIILGNSYHLHLRPGEDLIANQGGLASWSSWNGPTLTDSGGYQAYSLSCSTKALAKISDEGVRFRSHLDGRMLFFGSELVLRIQAKLNSDIAMVLDDCPPIEATLSRVETAVKRTTVWAKQSVKYWRDQGMGERGRGLFGIIQGGLLADLRRRSLEEIQALPFDGLAIGGVAIASEGKEKINRAVDLIADNLDPDRPHYLMGVGEPADLIRMIGRGMDMFDCVLPTRLARHGAFWNLDWQRLNLRRREFQNDPQPLDQRCSCRVCQTFSRAYLRHLYMSGETLAGRAVSYHNLAIIFCLIKEIRDSITAQTFRERFRSFL